jgi:hypothetical protein
MVGSPLFGAILRDGSYAAMFATAGLSIAVAIALFLTLDRLSGAAVSRPAI